MSAKINQIPPINTTTRNALVSPPAGSMIYHTDTMSMQYTSDGGSTWPKISDALNSSPRNMIYFDPVNGNDTIGTGTISSPFKTLPHAVSTILTSSFTNPFEVIMVSANSTETGIVDVPPGVTINGGGGILDLSGGTLQLRAAAWNGITNGFFNFVNFEKLSLPTCTLDLSNTVGPTTISIINVVPFNTFPTITINGSSTNYSNIYLKDIPEGDTQFLFNLNNSNIFIDSTNFADTVITVNNGLGYQINASNSLNNNLFNVNVNGALSEAVINCSSVKFLSYPNFNASNGGQILYDQTACTGGSYTFNNTGGTGGTINASLGIINNLPVVIGTPTVSYNIVLGDTLRINGNSGIYQTITNGQWNMDMSSGGNPSTWLMSSDFTMNFPYGGGGFNVNAINDVSMSSSAGNVNLTSQGGLGILSLGSGGSLTSDSDMTVGSGAGTLNLNGWTDIDLTTTTGTINLSSFVDINIQTQQTGNAGAVNITTGKGDTVANGINIKTDPVDGSGGPIVIQSTNSDVNLIASGRLTFDSNTIGMFGAGPVAQSAPIANASVLLTDVVAQFNTLLAYLRSRGDIST